MIGFIFLLRFLRGWMLHRTLRDAIERQLPEAGTLIERIGEIDARRGGGNDDRNGLVLIAIAIGLVAFALITVDDIGAQRMLFGGAVFPLLIGGVLLWRHRQQARQRDTGGERGIDRAA